MLHHYPSSLHKKVGGIRPSFVHTAFVHHLNLLKFTCTWLTVHVETQKFHTTLGIKIDPRPESRPLSNPHGLTVHKSLLRGGFGRLGQKTAIYRGFSTRSDELFSRRRAPRSGACAAEKRHRFHPRDARVAFELTPRSTFENQSDTFAIVRKIKMSHQPLEKRRSRRARTR